MRGHHSAHNTSGPENSLPSDSLNPGPSRPLSRWHAAQARRGGSLPGLGCRAPTRSPTRQPARSLRQSVWARHGLAQNPPSLPLARVQDKIHPAARTWLLSTGPPPPHGSCSSPRGLPTGPPRTPGTLPPPISARTSGPPHRKAVPSEGSATAHTRQPWSDGLCRARSPSLPSPCAHHPQGHRGGEQRQPTHVAHKA